MVKGRLPKESNPLPGDKSGFVASHDTTGEEDYQRTSPLNPLPVKSIGDSNVKDVAVKSELEAIKQSVADNKATNDLILARLDGTLDTQLTGSNVAHSDDEKPEGRMGDSLFLWNTRQVFLHDGTDWREV